MRDAADSEAGRTKAERLRVRGTSVTGEFGLGHQAARLAWYVVQGTLFRFPLRRCDWWRICLLRAFGARIGRRCIVRRTAIVEAPWNLVLGDDVIIGDRTILYSIAKVVIGDRTMVSQGAHLCAGDHDMRRIDLPLRRIPVSIGHDAWICADTFVGPGVDIGDGTVLGARSAAFRDLPAWTVCIGTPARPVRARTISSDGR